MLSTTKETQQKRLLIKRKKFKELEMTFTIPNNNEFYDTFYSNSLLKKEKILWEKYMNNGGCSKSPLYETRSYWLLEMWKKRIAFGFNDQSVFHAIACIDLLLFRGYESIPEGFMLRNIVRNFCKDSVDSLLLIAVLMKIGHFRIHTINHATSIQFWNQFKITPDQYKTCNLLESEVWIVFPLVNEMVTSISLLPYLSTWSLSDPLHAKMLLVISYLCLGTLFISEIHNRYYQARLLQHVSLWLGEYATNAIHQFPKNYLREFSIALLLLKNSNSSSLFQNM